MHVDVTLGRLAMSHSRLPTYRAMKHQMTIDPWLTKNIHTSRRNAHRACPALTAEGCSTPPEAGGTSSDYALATVWQMSYDELPVGRTRARCRASPRREPSAFRPTKTRPALEAEPVPAIRRWFTASVAAPILESQAIAGIGVRRQDPAADAWHR